MNFFRKNRNTILKYGFLAFLMVFTIHLVFKNLDVKAITDIKDIIDKKYIAIGIYVILAYIFLEGIILKQIIDTQYKVKAKFLGIKLAGMSFYYNLVTPFASGSQPMLIYVLTKYKVPFSEATGIVTNKTLLYQAVVTIYCMIFFFLNIGILRSQMPNVMPLVILGMSINAFTIIMGLLAILNPRKIKFVLNILIGYLSKFRILRFLRDKNEKINAFIDEYSQSVKFFMTNKKLLVKTTILTVVQLSAYFSVSFWIYKAFNLSQYHFMYMITLQTFLYMAVSPIPTPGNIGANELAFFTIFANVFPKPILGYAVLLYGGLVYYLILIGSGIMTIITHFQIKDTAHKSSGVGKI
ncbi:lysylphosphatidylglycerol synthase transmembrane domain-containing protein [Intestinibacter sp.]|uniref:lysylphosphatidylglycerol synthase transmembrane domain-containing protein n=1 Tax=Intestinibacter sp. TaxID=1965304 RepID=UPI002A75C0FE|nr:lysylphosphatidylglycerol synthase transmembrane domain-containing protein [Intestinibacter sp.]MDY2734807.1 lysylphosphatidylglycerol synthase transmembrane domain-containing protein [Intestinibacter sp.]